MEGGTSFISAPGEDRGRPEAEETPEYGRVEETEKERENLRETAQSESDGEEEERGGRMEEKESWTESAIELSEGESEEEEERRRDQHLDGDGSLADDEEEEEEEDAEEEDEGGVNKCSGQTRLAFTPLVTIVQPVSKQLEMKAELEQDGATCRMRGVEQREDAAAAAEWNLVELDRLSHQHQHHYHHDNGVSRRCVCGERVRLSVSLLAAVCILALLLWAGFELLPLDVPPLNSAPLRLLYTLRCSYFAAFPVVLGVLVHGVSRLRFGALKPLYDGKRAPRDVTTHGHYVRDSLHLYLLYFTQLAVMATYVSQDLLKLIPLLTVAFAIGRLIYWVCVVFGSSVRALGFGLSFLPMLVVIGANIYFVCSSYGQEAVFYVAPPPTTPPPKLRWWW